MAKELKDYTARMALFPSLYKPELLDTDGEFNYYKFIVPRVYVDFIKNNEVMSEPELEEAPAVLAMAWYPVHSGIIELGEDNDFYYYKVPVPQALVESRYGIMYRPYEEW
jgi:hypothetical protein